MNHSISQFAGFLFYVFPLFIGIGVLAWLATHKLEPALKRYGVIFSFLFLFPAFIPNIMWNNWQIHLLFPLIYLFFALTFQHEKISNFYLPTQPRYDNLVFALGVFFIYAFASTAWAYFPMQSFMMTVLQSISIGFTYLIFRRIHHTRAEMFTPSGEIARLCLTIGIGSFILLLLANDIVPKIYSIAISLFEENIEKISTNLKIVKHFEILTKLLFHRNFFDSGFTLFSVIAFPLAMLMPSRKASLFLLGGIFIAIFLTSNSQAAMTGLFCGICIVFFLPKIPRWAQQVTPWVMLGCITFFPFLITLLLPAISEFFNLAFVKESPFFIYTLDPRLWIYENTILLDIWIHPWFGCGIYAVQFDSSSSISIFNTFFAASAFGHTHNHTLTLLMELGITGLLFFIWICVCILRVIKTLNEHYQPYALGAFFSALCLTAFTQPLWGIAPIIWSVAFLMFAMFGRYPPVTDRQTNSAI